jgi:type I restriction enzyme S subunit
LEKKNSNFQYGSATNYIRMQNFEEYKIPLPSLSEQNHIIDILDKADAIRQKRQQAIKLADEFLRSVFLDMFGNPVTNPKGWPLGVIRELVSEVKYGTSKKASSDQKQFQLFV